MRLLLLFLILFTSQRALAHLPRNFRPTIEVDADSVGFLLPEDRGQIEEAARLLKYWRETAKIDVKAMHFFVTTSRSEWAQKHLEFGASPDQPVQFFGDTRDRRIILIWDFVHAQPYPTVTMTLALAALCRGQAPVETPWHRTYAKFLAVLSNEAINLSQPVRQGIEAHRSRLAQALARSEHAIDFLRWTTRSCARSFTQ